MNFPRRFRERVFVRCVASPERLDQRGSWLTASDHVLLPLLLLYFQGEAATENALQEKKKTKHEQRTVLTGFRKKGNSQTIVALKRVTGTAIMVIEGQFAEGGI